MMTVLSSQLWRKKIDWNTLNITGVYTACNVTHAQTIMTQNNINICVCDIEMPGKSGLDLLSWVRENNMDTLFIFLTSYADFSYAQKAISLSSMDYLLKPIDFSKLSQILEKLPLKYEKTPPGARPRKRVNIGLQITRPSQIYSGKIYF